MRLVPVLLLGAVAAAAPSVRWIDKLGDVQVTRLREVLVEEGRVVQGRLESGAPFEVELRRVLTLVRESESDPRERALLRARLDVAAGERLAAARPVLDGIVADAEAPKWMREYAAAARALLAERADDPDAAERISLFLAGHPKSRFASGLYRAQARVAARQAEGAVETIVGPILNAQKRIEKVGGPLLDYYLSFVDGAEVVLDRRPAEFSMYAGAGGSLLDQAEDTGDMARVVISRSAMGWLVLAHEGRLAADLLARGHRPEGPLERVRKALRRAVFDLPEVRCDLHLAHGRLLVACGDREAAQADFRRALELAPDPRRRAAAEAALGQK